MLSEKCGVGGLFGTELKGWTHLDSELGLEGWRGGGVPKGPGHC